jgi:hypothetical protein
MSEASKAYRAVLWISEKGLADIELFNERFTVFMRGILAKIDPERLANDVAIGEQWEELVELELLKGTLQVKDIAEESGGFDETHGPALELAANALYEHCGWEDEDITNWFGSLVMGAGVSVEFEDDEDEE